MKKSFIKAVQEGDIIKYQCFGITLVTRFSNGYISYSKNNLLTPSMQHDLKEKIDANFLS